MRQPHAFALMMFAAAIGPSVAYAQEQDRVSRPPAPAPVMIFFAWDKPVLDRDAAATLAQLAASLPGNMSVRLRVTGHADRSGPAAQNVRSARKRAEVVATYLTARGVPIEAISVSWLGEAEPLIATADGVREPQNRRVEILVEGSPR